METVGDDYRPLRGKIIAISGNFSAIKEDKQTLRGTIIDLGGVFCENVTEETTDLIRAQPAAGRKPRNGPRNEPRKVAFARKFNVQIHDPEWLLNFREAKEKRVKSCMTIPPQQIIPASSQKTAERARGGRRQLKPSTTYKPPPRPLKKPNKVAPRFIRAPSYQDEDGHYLVTPGAQFAERYVIVSLLGQGGFGKVVKARDPKLDKVVAIKIIRSGEKFRKASRSELLILETLKLNDADNHSGCIHIQDCFEYRGHICIVMELLGQSIYDFLKDNKFVPFPYRHIQSFARQLFASIAFLHDLGLVHADLKPENIVLCDSSYKTIPYGRDVPSSTTVSRYASQRRVLLNTEIRLIDFGLATFQDECRPPRYGTLAYCAPEIMLGLEASFARDIWSLGCLLVEFFTGKTLFEADEIPEYLAMMDAVAGLQIDELTINKKLRDALIASRNSAMFQSYKSAKKMKRLDQIIPGDTAFLRSFLDLLKRIFVFDPARRITAKQCLQHPWLRETAPPDDGTTAAEIRQQEIRKERHVQKH